MDAKQTIKWLGFLNYYVFQWLGIRIHYSLDEYHWRIMFPIKPLTGWNNFDYYPKRKNCWMIN